MRRLSPRRRAASSLVLLAVGDGEDHYEEWVDRRDLDDVARQWLAKGYPEVRCYRQGRHHLRTITA